jgi:ABC-type nickel/cobalt efflux system permease component RcnA
MCGEVPCGTPYNPWWNSALDLTVTLVMMNCMKTASVSLITALFQLSTLRGLVRVDHTHAQKQKRKKHQQRREPNAQETNLRSRTPHRDTHLDLQLRMPRAHLALDAQTNKKKLNWTWVGELVRVVCNSCS